MMRFTEIIEAIKKLNTEIKEAEERQNAETDRYFATFEGLTIKERIAQKKETPEAEAEHLQIISEIQETITNGKLKLKLMQNNARIALFNEVMPIVLEVLQKYNGKPHGEKTEKKIREEIKEKTNCFVYVNIDSFRIVPCGQSSQSMPFTTWFHHVAPTGIRAEEYQAGYSAKVALYAVPLE